MTRWNQLPWEPFLAVGQPVQRPWGGVSLVVFGKLGRRRPVSQEEMRSAQQGLKDNLRLWKGPGELCRASEQGRDVI